MLLPCVAFGYEDGEIFSVNLGSDEEPCYVQFQKMPGYDSEFWPVGADYYYGRCRVYAEEGSPAISPDYEGELEIPICVENLVVTEICDYAFAGCQGLTNVNIRCNAWIDGYSYHYCAIKEIGAHAFDGCSNLQSIMLPDVLTTINEYAFYNCSQLEEVYATDALTYIGVSAFENCVMLSYIVDISNAYIAERAFYNCSSLTDEIVVGGNVGPEAFYGSSFTSVRLVGVYINLGNNAFSGMNQLSLTLGANVADFQFEGDAFLDSSIESLSVEDGNSYYSSPNDCNAIIKNDEYNGATLILGCGNTQLSEDMGIIGIGDYALQQYWAEEIVIPKSVKYIGDNVFPSGRLTIKFTGVPESIGTNEFEYGSEVYYPAYAGDFFCSQLSVQTSDMHPYLKLDSEWQGFYFDNRSSFMLPDGMTAYIVDLFDETNNKLILRQVPYISPDNCYLIHDENYGTERLFEEDFSLEKEKYESNLLVGYSYENTVYEFDEEHVNFLLDGDTYTRITEENGVIVPAYEAWLQTYNVNNIGDVNDDEVFNYADVKALANYLVGKVDKNFVRGNADVNSDGLVTIADVTALIKKILMGQ